jgi:hypothetical protein
MFAPFSYRGYPIEYVSLRTLSREPSTVFINANNIGGAFGGVLSNFAKIAIAREPERLSLIAPILSY